MDGWLGAWLGEKYGDGHAEARVEDVGVIALTGEMAVWHPLDDLYLAPRIALGARVRLEVVHVGREIAGYVLRGAGEAASWRAIGDASTSTDRFFLVQVDQFAPVIDWLNEDPLGFEALGGDSLGDALSVATVARGDGARVVVLASPDGNARVRGGYTASGQLACAIIDACTRGRTPANTAEPFR